LGLRVDLPVAGGDEPVDGSDHVQDELSHGMASHPLPGAVVSAGSAAGVVVAGSADGVGAGRSQRAASRAARAAEAAPARKAAW
jgi:hypothetical protein